MKVSRRPRRLAQAAVVCAAAIALPVLATAGPAGAATLTASNVFCETTGTFHGITHMICTVSIAGGTAPYTQAWTGSNASFGGRPLPGGGNCGTNQYYTVSVTVHDSSGHTASSGGKFFCNAVPI